MSSAPATQVTLSGTGLFSGAQRVVRLSQWSGPLAFAVAGTPRPLAALNVQAEGRTTVLSAADFRLACVEHFLAAAAGLGVGEGLLVEVDGDELPLLDGGALAFCEALVRLPLQPVRPALRVAQAETLRVGGSTYTFVPPVAGDECGVTVEVELDGADARLVQRASWDGSREAFLRDVAPARTFAYARDIEGMIARGLAVKVDPTSVVLLADHAVYAAGRPFSAGEPARHKLLDLIGDLRAHGGPPLGRVSASRPGHGVTHAVVAEALRRGVLLREPGLAARASETTARKPGPELAAKGAS